MRAGINSVIALLVLAAPVLASEQSAQKHSRVAIIIDDLGYSWKDARRVVQLPGPVACSILPHTRFSKEIAQLARNNNKEILLHLPMASSQIDKDPGPGKLEPGMTDLEFELTIDYDLQSVPHATGINNHMGSQLTQHLPSMASIMKTLGRKKGVFFIDSLTSPNSVAAKLAKENGVPNLTRDIFLDNTPTEKYIHRQFDRLLKLSRKHGNAIAIGHPYAETLSVLEQRLPGLMAQNIQLVRLSSMLAPTEERLIK